MKTVQMHTLFLKIARQVELHGHGISDMQFAIIWKQRNVYHSRHDGINFLCRRNLRHLSTQVDSIQKNPPTEQTRFHIKKNAHNCLNLHNPTSTKAKIILLASRYIIYVIYYLQNLENGSRPFTMSHKKIEISFSRQHMHMCIYIHTQTTLNPNPPFFSSLNWVVAMGMIQWFNAITT